MIAIPRDVVGLPGGRTRYNTGNLRRNSFREFSISLSAPTLLGSEGKVVTQELSEVHQHGADWALLKTVKDGDTEL